MTAGVSRGPREGRREGGNTAAARPPVVTARSPSLASPRLVLPLSNAVVVLVEADAVESFAEL